MNFQLSEEQQMLADSAKRFVRDNSDVETHRRNKKLMPLDAATWQQFADLGWLAVPFEEEHGGLGMGPLETMVLLEALGEGLIMAPYIATVVLGGGFLRQASAAQQAETIPALLEGKLQVAFAAEEYERVFTLENTAMVADLKGNEAILNGTKSCVMNGDQADLLVVLARTAGKPGDQDGLSLFLVDVNAPGVERVPHRTVDGRQGAEIRFNQVKVAEAARIGALHGGYAIARQVLHEGLLALSAESVGSLSVLLNETVEYSKTRKQFGMPIGKFQVLQFRMADMFIAMEQTRSLLLAATLKTVEGHDDAAMAVHAMKAQLGRAGRNIAQEAIQIHGGMGMTDELGVGHYVKRVTGVDGLFGNADVHLMAIARSA
ncbi:Acyl-CoA dehydrogenase [Alcanivorax sp. DSM 26293]|uniref:acyl-CoA dehydrogenase family protein n=1 Tax=Alcanivorax sp. DSM 26293 TaxID=1798238 RepID=UPI00089FCF76|nr:acyl-CoA dehydrogenase family protein [Alcanivorax sp. DSM 26293]MEE3386913.1 acyl-CoA dehydrogenase family protein [Pseudomonadota bacterium]SEG23494.1 Acyl-CoA dehydrogenase [Alcanivorax sp. DSM 26293]